MNEEYVDKIVKEVTKLTNDILSRCYVLDGKTPRKCASIQEYHDFDVQNKNRIARSHISNSTISTVFLMHDHNWNLEGPPILFETMVFGGEMDGYQERYASYDEAVEGHKRICEMAEGQEIFCLTALTTHE